MWPNINIDLHELNSITIVVRIALAIIVGGIVGLERNLKNRSAGLRTYILVCLGAAIVMMTNQYVVNMYPEGLADPTRMGAQVVSGVGFLGAGTILVTSRNRVKGLTTAAGLWASACIGLAIGIGFYSGAIIGGLTILVIMTLFKPIKRLAQDKANYIDLYVIVDSVKAFNDFLQYCSDSEVNILNLHIDNEHEKLSENVIYFVSLDLEGNIKRDQFEKGISKIDGVKYTEKLELD